MPGIYEGPDVLEPLWSMVPAEARGRTGQEPVELVRALGSLGFGRAFMLQYDDYITALREPLAHSLPLNMEETSHAVVYQSGNVYVVHQPLGSERDIADYRRQFGSGSPYLLLSNDALLGEHNVMRFKAPIDRHRMLQSTRPNDRAPIIAALHAAVALYREQHPEAGLSVTEWADTDRLLGSVFG